MKLSTLKFLAIFLIITSSFAGAFLDYFHVRTENDDAVIEWKTSREIDVKNFVIERRDAQSGFSEIKIIEPKGDNSFYSFRDKAVYKTKDYIFIYRIKIVDNNNQVTYSNEASVSLSISGVKRTCPAS